MSFLAGVNTVGSLGLGVLNYFGQRENSRRNAATARYNTDQTIKANRELAEYQFSKNLEMWHLQNQYNSPAEQMQRFQNAGLNPNLIYGQGTPGNANSAPQYQAPREDYNYKAEQIPNLAESMSLALMQSQTALQFAQSKKIEAETEVISGTKDYTIQKAGYDTLSAMNKAFVDDIKAYQEQHGVLNATPQVKFLFQQLRNSYLNPESKGNITITPEEEKQLRQALTGAMLSAELKDWLGKIGFGFLFQSKK
ncbi:MAG: hypothetical protein ACMZ7B_11025 [Balneola sp.]